MGKTMEKSGEAGSGPAGKGKKQKKVKTGKKHDPHRTEVSKAIRMLRNTLTAKALARASENSSSYRHRITREKVQKAIERAQPYKSEIQRRAPAVYRMIVNTTHAKKAG